MNIVDVNILNKFECFVYSYYKHKNDNKTPIFFRNTFFKRMFDLSYLNAIIVGFFIYFINKYMQAKRRMKELEEIVSSLNNEKNEKQCEEVVYLSLC